MPEFLIAVWKPLLPFRVPACCGLSSSFFIPGIAAVFFPGCKTQKKRKKLESDVIAFPSQSGAFLSEKWLSFIDFLWES